MSSSIKPQNGVLFVIPDTPSEIQGSKFVHADIDTIGTAAPITGVVYAAGKTEQVKQGDRICFERGTGLRMDTSDLCEHDLLIVIPESHVFGIIGKDTDIKMWA